MIAYKEPSIISRTGTAIWSKTNFGPTGHHHPQGSPIPHVCTVPSASATFKCILNVVFCEGGQHRLRFCLDHLGCVKMAALQFYLQQENREKLQGPSQASRVGRGRQSCCFW
jgi:hypothetical protein